MVHCSSQSFTAALLVFLEMGVEAEAPFCFLTLVLVGTILYVQMYKLREQQNQRCIPKDRQWQSDVKEAQGRPLEREGYMHAH